MTDRIVMRDSPEAAEYRTDIRGWVSRAGHYYGDSPSSEDTARYAGCTHVACKYCAAPTEKPYTACAQCRDRKALERFEALPRAEWDGVAMLYSDTRSEYYKDIDEAEDGLEKGETLADLRLLICEPIYVRRIDGDLFCDDLPEGEERLPPVVEQAIEAFNAAVAGIILSWTPSKVALNVGGQP